MNGKPTSAPRRPPFLWLWILVALVALVVGAVFAVRAYVTPERAHAFAQQALSTSLHREVKFDQADLTFWPPVSVSVTGLAVSDPQGFKQGTMLSARNVRLGLDLWALFSRRLLLNGVVLDHPAVRLWRSADGHANWEGLGGTSDTSKAQQPQLREVSLPGVHIAGARLGYFGPDNKLAFYFEDLDLDLTKAGQGWNWSLRVGKLGNPNPIPNLDQPILAKGSTGEVKPGAPVSFKLSAECGDLSLSGQGVASPTQVDFTNGHVARKGAPASLDDLRARYISDAKGSRIDAFDGRVASSRFAGAVVLEPPPLRGTFKGNLDLAELSQFLPQEQRGITGRANIAVQFIVPSADVRGAQLQGLVDLANVSVPARAKDQQPLTGLNGRIWFSQLSANTTGLEGRYGNLPFRVSGKVDEPLALANAMDPKAPANARVATIHFDLTTGAVDADALFPPGKPMEKAPLVVADGVIQAPRLKSQKLDVSDVTAKFRYDRGMIHLDGASATGYQGKITATGDVDFRNPPKPVYSLSVQGAGLDAPTVMHAWAPPIGGLLTGAFDVNLTVSGNGFDPKEALTHLSLDALAKSADGRLAGAELLKSAAKWTGLADLSNIQFKNLLWHIVVQNGRVQFRDVNIKGLDSEYSLGGSMGLTGDLGLSVAMAVPSSKMSGANAQLRQFAQLLSDKSGRVLLNFSVGGNVRNPQFALNTDKTANLLAQNLEQQILGKALDPLAKALGDSLSKQKTLQGQIDGIASQQSKVLQDGVAKQQNDVMSQAAGWIGDILNPKSKGAAGPTTAPVAPPPPPASDTSKAPPRSDTTAARLPGAPDTTKKP
jgi:uncharacterized protein involved in outer membrane biogenesis